MTLSSNATTLDANGVGRVDFTPAVYAASWELTKITVQCESSSDAKVLMYLNSVGTSTFIGGTYSGNFDTDSQPNLTLQATDTLIIVWEGGDPGSNATATITYNVDTGRSR